MLTLKDFLNTVNYRITEGSAYGWTCFGENAFCLDSWSGQHDQGYSASATFDLNTQVLYTIELADYDNDRAYRWVNKSVADRYRRELQQRGLYDVAWDDVNYVTVETDRDFLAKFEAIVNRRPYDPRIEVPIELTDKEMLTLYEMAHRRDITLNKLVEEVLMSVVNERMDNDSTS